MNVYWAELLSTDLKHNYPEFGERELSISYFPIEGPAGVDRVACVLQDITERKQAGEALRSEREQLLSIFESINEVILVIDPQTHEILYANTFAENLYGKKLKGEKCYETLNSLDRPCEYCDMENIIGLQGQPFKWEYNSPVLKKDFLATDRIIRWSDGRDVKLHIAVDITERKLAEQEKENLSSQLLQAQKMEAIGTLAGGVAHDFNNLLQVVLGYSELILSEKGNRDRFRDDLTKIHQAATNGADLVQRLLTFSRKTESKPRPLNLNHRIEQVQKMLSRTIPKMIDIHLTLDRELAAINADPTQMEQILMNLAINARDAMPEGGRLIIKTENVVLDEHYCKAHPEATSGQNVSLSLTDTGKGMDSETVDHIFEPFFTTKAPGEGTGLGLATVYGIVKQHNGHVVCRSVPGEGTTFEIYFPALVSKEEPKEPIVGTLPRGGSETILLVDDEELIRDVGSKILTKAGYKVITASNGKEAVEVYKQRKDEVSLVILDLIMPEMGGKQCLETLLEFDPSAKVIIASGYFPSEETKAVLASGAEGFINKPYNISQLLEIVSKAIEA